MFTLGREREKQHSHRYLRSQKEAWRIEAVIDAVHDLLDGTKDPDGVRSVFADAFTNGGSGVWEQTGSWLRKISKNIPPSARCGATFLRIDQSGFAPGLRPSWMTCPPRS